MHKVTFFPLGNADTCLIDLSGGQMLLFDYADMRNHEDENDKRIDLPTEIRQRMQDKNKEEIDVVAFTHADDDHIHGSSEFFYLEHAAKYQDKNRIHIKELWVPAAMILEEGAEDEVRILRAEARYRLKKGKGIRVFSRPDRLKEWLKSEGLTIEERANMVTNAGEIVPSFNKYVEGIEFFVHSPFAAHVDDRLEDRNESALILHLTFLEDGRETRLMLIGDSTHQVLFDIVQITKYHRREERLMWDIYDIPHHCSYLALSDEKGKDKTEAVSDVQWLLDQGRSRGNIISCSDPIPGNDKSDQPPHRQAANCYKDVASKITGQFKVTMEHPNTSKPEPLVITIDKSGATIRKVQPTAATIATSRPAPRAGRTNGR